MTRPKNTPLTAAEREHLDSLASEQAGIAIEVDKDLADQLGAFEEDAISLNEAVESNLDRVDADYPSRSDKDDGR